MLHFFIWLITEINYKGCPLVLMMWKIFIEPPEMKSDFDFFQAVSLCRWATQDSSMAGDKLLQTQPCLKSTNSKTNKNRIWKKKCRETVKAKAGTRSEIPICLNVSMFQIPGDCSHERKVQQDFITYFYLFIYFLTVWKSGILTLPKINEDIKTVKTRLI